MPKIKFKIISLLVWSAISGGAIFAALPATLDQTFGNGGKIFTSFEGQNFHWSGNVIKRQADGKIVMGCNVGQPFVCLARYNADGSLDASFGSGGKVVTNLPEGTSDNFMDMALQPDGKILVAGWIRYDFPFHSKGFILRYNSNGTLDPSFDGDGKRFLDSLSESGLDAVAVQPDGKIVAAGNGMGGVMAVRLLSDGAFDSTFSGDGAAVITLYACYIDAIALQSDGKIVIAGSKLIPSTNSDNTWFVVRYNSDGSADTSFDGDGILFTAWEANGSGDARALVIQSDGKILVAGSARPGDLDTRSHAAVARYNNDGSLDTSFGGDGKVALHIGPVDRDEPGADVILRPDGKILLLANSVPTYLSPPAAQKLLELLRLNTDGSLNGATTLHVDGSTDNSSSILLQPNGKLLVAGTAVGAGDDHGRFFLLRFNNSDQSPFDFDGDGKTDISIYRPVSGEWWIARSSGGNIAAPFGSSSARISPADFTGDGKTDIAFWRGASGEWFVFRSEDQTYYSFPFGTTGDVPEVGDFDGDGKADAAIFRPATAIWYISRSSGGTTIQQFGLTGDVPVPADYDGDGKADIAIYRMSDGKWWIQRSTFGVIAFQFGTGSDKPVPGDYTGDGKTDAAIWRPSTGEWFILRSEDQSFYSFPFGISTDMPSPGDYDGDGRFDAGVFRSSNARWYVQRSTAGTMIQTFGQTGDRPVPNAFVP